MAQMEKTQQQQDTKTDAGGQGKKPKGGAKGSGDKRPRGLNYPEVNDPKMMGEIKRMAAITPYGLASQFNLRLSIAKALLEYLEIRNIVTLDGRTEWVR